MKKEYKLSHIIMVLSLAAVIAVSGCTKEDMTTCEWIPARVQISPVVGEGEASPTIDGVTLFVFDSDDSYLGQVQGSVDEVISLDYPTAGQLKVIAVANNKETEVVSPCNSSGSLDGGSITLSENESYVLDGVKIYKSPSDLFYGTVLHPNIGKNRAKVEKLPINRIVGSVKFTAKKFREYHNEPSTQDFSIVACTKHKTFNFKESAPTGEDVGYRPETRFETGDIFLAPRFNVMSSAAGENVSLKIYKGDEYLYTIDTDSKGQPLKVSNGKLLDVYIDYSGDISVSVDLNGWGQETNWDKVFGE